MAHKMAVNQFCLAIFIHRYKFIYIYFTCRKHLLEYNEDLLTQLNVCKMFVVAGDRSWRLPQKIYCIVVDIA